MKFGLHYQLPCSAGQSPVQRYRDTIEQAVHAEVLGFESVWPVEQHFNSSLSIMPSPLLMLAAIAERTRTLRLGIAIILLPLWHPLRAAEEIATLDVLSNGRVEFGIGRGGIPKHFKGFGVPIAENRDRFAEALEVIRQAWTNESLSYHGRFYDFDRIAVVPKPIQQPHPPIRVAANSEDTFAATGQMGLPIFAASQVNPFNRIKRFLATYREARQSAGNPAATAEDVSILTPLYAAESAAQVRREIEPSIKYFLSTATSLFGSGTPPPGTPRSGGSKSDAAARLKQTLERLASLTYENVSERMAIFDTPQGCVERLKGLQQDFNMGRVICWFNPGGQVPHNQVMRSMELFAAKVMPHFQ
ncbi:MAG: LLM class flavin-dependent oxidoreductase [Candidatus Binataceae bacterium]|jgi:alkanesulfonate monooxygenase SsuD/methylene tetrahydromethanopterin reductase-like flavin-dependent oxidoreductase (luciferase family)